MPQLAPPPCIPKCIEPPAKAGAAAAAAVNNDIAINFRIMIELHLFMRTIPHDRDTRLSAVCDTGSRIPRTRDTRHQQCRNDAERRRDISRGFTSSASSIRPPTPSLRPPASNGPESIPHAVGAPSYKRLAPRRIGFPPSANNPGARCSPLLERPEPPQPWEAAAARQ